MTANPTAKPKDLGNEQSAAAKAAKAPKVVPKPGTPVVLDTNALLMPFTESTDIERELERILGQVRIIVPSSIAWELGRLAQQDTNAGRAAKMAQKLAKRFEEVETKLRGDDGVLEAARSFKAFVVTNDKVLQQQCKLSKLRVIRSRGKGQLDLIAS